MKNLPQTRQATAARFTQPLVQLIARTPITPATLTWLGLILAIVAAVLIASGHFLIAGVVVLLGGCFDMLDGALARYTKRTTHFGAILDSTLDRLSEGALLLGVMALYAREPSFGGVLLAGTALLGSMLVSYLRARGEALGLECRVGLFTRPERVVVLALGLLLSYFSYALVVALSIITVLSFFTAGQRAVHLWQQTRGR